MLFGLDSWIFWLILVIAFIALEAITVNMVSIWFAVGSLAALILSLIGFEIWIQITAMIGLSIILFGVYLVLVKPRLSHATRKVTATNADRIIGEEGIVTVAIDPLTVLGQIQVLGQVWSALSETHEPIAVGTTVVVTEIRGVRAVVRQAIPQSDNN